MPTVTRTIRNLFDDFWWRFSAYEVRDGYIRPAAGAELKRYYPWLEFQRPEGKRPLKRIPLQHPYHSLLDLVARIGSYPFAADQERELLDWCARHGLLGILPHQSEMAVMPRVDERSLRYYRHAGGWQAIRTREDLAPGIFMRHYWSAELRFEPLHTWGAFFPDVPIVQRNQHIYPVPFSERFWHLYAEPVSEFLHAARCLRAAVAPDSVPGDRLLLSLTAPVQTVPYMRGRRRAVGWASGSLLAAYAIMATFDLANLRLGTCKNRRCGASFAANSRRARYCSATCRTAAEMRKYRILLDKRKEK